MLYLGTDAANPPAGASIDAASNARDRRWLRAGVLPAAALITVALSAQPSFADSGQAFVESFNPTNIEVKSDGSQYTAPAIPLISMLVQLKIHVDAGVSGRVKSWKAWPIFKADNGFKVSLSNYAAQASYNIPRPKTVDTGAPVNIPYGSLAPFATGHCNRLADTLRGQGLSDGQIFSQNRVIPVMVSADLTYETTGISGAPIPTEVTHAKSFNLICKASDPQRVPPTASDPTRTPQSVDQATVTVHEVATLGGACKLNVSGVIVTKEPNKQVKFRYKDDNGQQSDVKTVNTDQTKTVFFNHQYSLSGGGHKQGKIRIDIVGENVTSPWSNYDVDCPDGGGLGGIVQQPGVKPGGVAQGAATDVKPQAPIMPGRPAVGGKATASGPTRPGSVTAKLGKPDLMATTLGMSIAGGPNAWGSTVVISNPAQASAKGIGPNGNLCRFDPVAFRPFNKGTLASGPFATRVYRNNQPVHSANFNLEAKSGLPANAGWHKFTLDLAQGMNVIKVVLDANKSVAESDEGNNQYTLRVRVNFACTAAQSGTPTRKAAPTRPTPETTPPAVLRKRQ